MQGRQGYAGYLKTQGRGGQGIYDHPRIYFFGGEGVTIDNSWPILLGKKLEKC